MSLTLKTFLKLGAPAIRLSVSIALSFALLGGNAISQQTSSVSHAASHLSHDDSPFKAAQQLFQQGQLEQARQEALAQLKINSSSVEGYNLLGIICSELKDFPDALEALQHALKLDPRSTQTRNNIGNVEVAAGRPDLAKREFLQVLAGDPANRDANYSLGLLLLAADSPVEAISHFQKVRSPNVETRLNLIHAYLRAGKTAEGLKQASILSVENKNKDDVELHVTLGILLASEKQYKAAEIQLEAANALRPDTFEILYNLGKVHFLTAENAQAELILSRALKAQPQSIDTMYLLAEVYSSERRPVDALDLLVRAHKLAPENPDVIFLLARLSMSQNYFEDAIPLLESGIKLAPKRADLHAALGESYFMAGKTENALAEFRTLVAVDPAARSYAFMGLSYRDLGRFDDARKYFDEGLKLDPNNASCLFNIGFIEERQGNYAKAEDLFQRALRANPDFSEALLELANLRTKDKKFSEAEVLLKRFVQVSHDPSTGYYKLAMVERSLHETEAAQRDLNVFQTLSKNAATGPYPYQHLFEYLDNRSSLPGQARTESDLKQLTEEIQKHPGQPQDLYLLAETYLKLGQADDARKAISQLDQLSANDFRTQSGVGVLLARYHLYDEAIQHFQAAARANSASDDVKFDIANAYFHKGAYADALQAAQSISPAGLQDDASLALLGDIYSHLGDTSKAAEIFRSAINRNPDNDQYYVSLTLLQLRGNDLTGAEQTLDKGLTRIPNSGKIVWGLGLVSVLDGKTAQAAERLERAVELLPEWAGSYSTLGLFYYQTGQIDKAREVLDRFKGSNIGGLDVARIEETLSNAPTMAPSGGKPLPMEARQQLLQMALAIADRTL